MTVTIQDTTFTGDILNQLEIKLVSQSVTVKEIITNRVKTEVQRYNEGATPTFNGLIQPTDLEKTLNGIRTKKKRNIDAEKQVYIALDSFKKNSYFIIIDDTQADSLEQQVKINQNTKVCFIKLTPLVGG